MEDNTRSSRKRIRGSVGLGALMGFGVVIFLLSLSALIAYHNTHQLYATAQHVLQSYAVQGALADVFSTMKDIENGQGGYIVTGDKKFLEPYTRATDQIRPQCQCLGKLIASEARHQNHFATLQQKIDIRLNLARQANLLREEKGFNAAQQFITRGDGKRIMDDIRTLVLAMQQTERDTLAAHEQLGRRYYWTAVAAGMLATLLGLGLVGVAFQLARRKLAERRRAAEALHEQREWFRVTLNSIGDAVIVTNDQGIVTFVNPVASTLTGWGQSLLGKTLSDVLQLAHEETEQRIDGPVTRVLHAGITVGHASQTVLIARDGKKIPIDYSSAPIRDPEGKIAGVVLVFRDITELRRATRELQASEARYRLLFETAQDAILILAEDTGRILDANPYLSSLLDYSHEELVGKEYWEIGLPQQAQDCRAIFEQLRQQGQLRYDHLPLRRKDGNVVDVEFVCKVSGDHQRKIVQCNVRDIRPRRRAEEALAKWEFIFRHAGWSVATIAPEDNTLVTINPAFANMHGYGVQELVGLPLADLLAPESRAELPRHAQQAHDKGDHVYESIHLRKDGTCFPVLTHVSDLKGQNHQGLYRAATFQDITEQKQAEESLREARDRLRSVVDHVMHGIIIYDETGRVESVNPAAEQVFGYPAAEIVGQDLRKLIPEPSLAGPPREAREARGAFPASTVSISREVQGRRKNGTTLLIDLAVSTFHHGGRRLFTGIIRDITERKQMEKELRQRAELLTEADRRKNEFLAMLAHELRNPLAPIQNAVHLLRHGSPLEEAHWAQEVIVRQVQHMARLVDDLLDISRITQGKINLNKQPVEVAAIVRRAQEMVQPLIDSRKHRFTVTLPPRPVQIQADLPRLAQALANLLNNAAKYTQEGGNIWLTVERQGKQVVLRVKDSGIGISADYLPHVFDLFSQQDSSLERTQGGLGIGLTLVRTLVQMHGGTIRASSAGEGQGSEFEVHLPVLTTPIPPEASPITQEQTARPLPRQILVVDDNVDSARSLSILLRQAGHQVQTAHDGIAALEAARATPPDIVLLDIGLPRMNGLEVARKMRGELGLTGAFLIAMTGYGQDADRHRSQEAGFNVHMVKPLDLEALNALLARTDEASMALVGKVPPS